MIRVQGGRVSLAFLDDGRVVETVGSDTRVISHSTDAYPPFDGARAMVALANSWFSPAAFAGVPSFEAGSIPHPWEKGVKVSFDAHGLALGSATSPRLGSPAATALDELAGMLKRVDVSLLPALRGRTDGVVGHVARSKPDKSQAVGLFQLARLEICGVRRVCAIHYPTELVPSPSIGQIVFGAIRERASLFLDPLVLVRDDPLPFGRSNAPPTEVWWSGPWRGRVLQLCRVSRFAQFYVARARWGDDGGSAGVGSGVGLSPIAAYHMALQRLVVFGGDTWREQT